MAGFSCRSLRLVGDNQAVAQQMERCVLGLAQLRRLQCRPEPSLVSTTLVNHICPLDRG